MQENPEMGNDVPVKPSLEALRIASIIQLDSLNIVPKKKKSTYSFKDLYALKDEQQKFMLPDLIAAQVVSVLIGEDGIGKTQITTELCLAVAMGFDTFLGLPLYAPNKSALICATEESRFKFTQAILKQAHYMQPNLNPDIIDIDFTEGSDFDDFLTLKNELEEQLSIKKRDIVIVDAFSDLFMLIDGDINNNSHARKLLSFFQHLCNEYETTIIVIHHAAKTKITAKHRDGKLFLEKNDSQGAGAITQKARTVLALSNDPKSISEDGRRYTNYFHVLKTNVMSKTYVNKAFELQFNTDYLLHKPVGFADIKMMEEGTTAVPASEQAEADSNNKRKPLPAELSDELHYQTLDKVFDKSDFINKNELKAKMTVHYGVGMQKIEQAGGYLAYIREKNFITKTDDGWKYNRPVKKTYTQPEIKLVHEPEYSYPDNWDQGIDIDKPF